MTTNERGVAYIAQSVFRVVREEFSGIRPRIHAARLISSLVPLDTGGQLRVRLLKGIGCSVGTGTVVADLPKITGVQGQSATNLRIGANCTINVGCEFEIAQTITIGDNVSIGHQTLVLTTTHELGPRTARAGAPVTNPVVIEDGVSIGPRCVILPGVTIGAGSIVEPCSVVNTKIPANVRVAGTPARQIEVLHT